MIPDPRQHPVLSVTEAGQLCGLGRSAAYDAARRGELPTLRFNRRVVVPTAKLLALLGLLGSESTVNGESPPKRRAPDSITTALLAQGSDGYGTG